MFVPLDCWIVQERSNISKLLIDSHEVRMFAHDAHVLNMPVIGTISRIKAYLWSTLGAAFSSCRVYFVPGRKFTRSRSRVPRQWGKKSIPPAPTARERHCSSDLGSLRWLLIFSWDQSHPRDHHLSMNREVAGRERKIEGDLERERKNARKGGERQEKVR